MLGFDVLYVGIVDEVSSPVWCSALPLMRMRYVKGTGRIPARTLIHMRDAEANVSFGRSVCSSLCLSRSNLNRIAIIQRDGIRQCIIIYSRLSQTWVSEREPLNPTELLLHVVHGAPILSVKTAYERSLGLIPNNTRNNK